MVIGSKLFGLVIGFAFLSSGAAFAADVALVSGLYKKESEKKDGVNAGSTSTLGAGGRYHDDLGESLAWYGIGDLNMQSYSAPDGRKAPDNGMSMKFGGGIRHYFKAFATAVVPYGSAGADVRNIKSVSWQADGYEESTTNGLYYNAAMGVRTGLDSNIFVEIELPLFDRALFAVAKTVRSSTVAATGATTETKEETTYNELWVSSFEYLPAIRIALGYKF
ncbi:MAG: hypothetical protein NTV34_06305 [Proteobacteria bacterium]|nr:hypothetical protein [Pseudomonadota bacterium]